MTVVKSAADEAVSQSGPCLVEWGKFVDHFDIIADSNNASGRRQQAEGQVIARRCS